MPATASDPSGLQKKTGPAIDTQEIGEAIGSNGAFVWGIRWHLPKARKGKGSIVQRVTITDDVKIAGKPFTPPARGILECCGWPLDQAAFSLIPSINLTPAITSPSSSEPFRARHRFEALC